MPGTDPEPKPQVTAMGDNIDIRQRLRELFRSQNLGVLSTHRQGQPYASLIAYDTSGDLRHFYFATPKTTRKYQNLKADPRVAVLVSSSTNQPSDFHLAIAATMVGEARELAVSENKAVMDGYLKKHPHLADFVRSPTTALVEVTARSYYVVRNFQNVIELHLTP